jgi:hypothetical protein
MVGGRRPPAPERHQPPGAGVPTETTYVTIGSGMLPTAYKSCVRKIANCAGHRIATIARRQAVVFSSPRLARFDAGECGPSFKWGNGGMILLHSHGRADWFL